MRRFCPCAAYPLSIPVRKKRNYERLDGAGNGNLMTSLIRASDDISTSVTEATETDMMRHKQNGLTQDEIFGNMFVFSFAGQDTTSHSLAYTIMLLTANPEVQDWMSEELRYVFKDENSSAWNYEESLLKLKRTLAILVSTPTIANV